MKLFLPDSRHRRTLGAVFAITFVTSVLLTAFYQTQVLSGELYAVRSESNRLRPIPIPAPRGTIVDRNGDVVATSVTGYSVSLLPGDSAVIRQTLVDLSPFLGLAGADVETMVERRNRRPNDLLEVSPRATYSQIAAIEERRAAFPNLMIVERPTRYYPAGAAIGHMIGYVNEITATELEQPRFRDAGYTQGRWIGKAGIEREYEMLLAGSDGARFVEVDAMGRVVDPRASVGSLRPTPGQPLQLTLDLGLQQYLAEIFPDTMKGAIAVLVPSTGEVLALVSHPGFDPNDFVGGIAPTLWRALNTHADKPLLDRTVNATYPPASTWKLATAAAGLERGVVKGNSRMPISCTGGMYYAGRYARCWYSAGHGRLDLVSAIEKSCNVYFYQLGIRLGLANLTQAGTRMGFNTRSGIDLPNETAGQFPTGVDWYERRFGHEPTPSEVMSLSIGQGPNAQTVLRMAHFYSAMAGNGSAPEPHLVKVAGAGEGAGAIQMRLSSESLQAMWAGLERVTNAGGTAYLSRLERWTLYGKTGTAQNPHGEDHGWFAGFAGPPGSPPEVAFAVIVEHGLHGSDVSPLGAKAANYYLSKKYGVPFESEATLIERWNSQRCPWGSVCQAPTREAALFKG
ncbi:MAG: penicillin-binding protein 2, partial [Gemmatimonadota bacterium]|nr:penicillin-binding protein 2 [Gemmatimonadota bacterium]